MFFFLLKTHFIVRYLSFLQFWLVGCAGCITLGLNWQAKLYQRFGLQFLWGQHKKKVL